MIKLDRNVCLSELESSKGLLPFWVRALDGIRARDLLLSPQTQGSKSPVSICIRGNRSDQAELPGQGTG